MLRSSWSARFCCLWLAADSSPSFSRVEYASQSQVALTPDSMEMLCADFESRSLSIRNLCSSCRCGRRDRGRPGEQGSARSKTDAAKSLSPRARLASASREHERTEREEMGRSHPGARRTERQHLGLSSLLQRQA